MFLGMPIKAKELSALEVKRLTKPGWHAVGGVPGLLLQIKSPVAKSWILRVRIGGARHPIGLGPYPQITLATARDKARQYLSDIHGGENPISKRKASKTALVESERRRKTFRDCAEAYLQAHASDYSNEKHRKQWKTTLQAYAYPIIGATQVSELSVQHILEVMNQKTSRIDGGHGSFWQLKTETAKRVLDRIRNVLDYATVNGFRTGVNPAAWKGHLETLLPSPAGIKRVKHHPSIPYDQIADFVRNLRAHSSISAKALEFLILTAVRSGSVRQAKWTEIDFGKKVWTIPPENTKTRQEHRVPLAPKAIDLLENLPRFAGCAFIFPGVRGKPLSDMALSQLMRGMAERGELTSPAVPHGFRSTFRDWAAEQTNYPDEIRKAASGHSVGDSVKQAYQRTDLLEKRRQLMNEWAKFIDQISQKNTNNIYKIGGISNEQKAGN